MKRSTVQVPWQKGLHLLPASRLVRVAQNFRSSISLRFRGRVADVRSILSVVALCATMGVTLDIEVTGDDEQNAIAAVEQEFTPYDDVDGDRAELFPGV